MDVLDLTKNKEIAKLYDLYAEEFYEQVQKNNKLLQKQLQLEEKLVDTLTEKQQENYEKIEDMKAQNIIEEEKKIFTFGFKLGVRLILESLNIK